MVILKKLHSLTLPSVFTFPMFVVWDVGGMLLIGDGFAAVQVSDRFPGQMKRPVRQSQMKSALRLDVTMLWDSWWVQDFQSTAQGIPQLSHFSPTQTKVLLKKGSEHSSKNMLSHEWFGKYNYCATSCRWPGENTPESNKDPSLKTQLSWISKCETITSIWRRKAMVFPTPRE